MLCQSVLSMPLLIPMILHPHIELLYRLRAVAAGEERATSRSVLEELVFMVSKI